MSSYGDVIFRLNNPQEQFQRFEAQDSALHSNSLEDSIRQNQIDAGKETTKQERIKTQQVDRAWEAQKAYADALKKNIKLVPAPGYADAAEAMGQPKPPATGVDPQTGRPSLAMDNGATPVGANDQPGNSLSAAVATAPGLPIPPTPAAMNNSLAGSIAPPSATPMPPPTSVPASSTPSSVSGVEPLKPMDHSDPSTYKVVYDQEGINRDLTAAGYGPEAIVNDKNRAEALTKVVDQHIKTLDETAKRQKILADSVASVPQTNFNETDPQKLAQQQSDSQAAAIQQLRYAVQNGGIDPGMEQQLEQQIRAGWTPQLQAQMVRLGKVVTSAHEQHIEALDATREHREQITANSTNTERDLSSQQKRLANAAQTATTVRDQGSLDSWYGKLSPDAKKDFADVYKQGYSLQTVKDIENMGRTEEQRVRDAEIRSQHEIVNGQRAERESFLEANRVAGRNQDRAQLARDYSALTKLQSDERKAYVERSRLAQELANAKSGKPWLYIQKGGGTKPSSQLAGDTDQQSAISDMQARKDALTDSVKEIINQKYDITRDTGRVSREEALAAVEGEQPKEKKVEPPAPIVKTPKAASPTPAVKQARTLDASKPADMDIAREYLKKAGGDKVKARTLAKADGYTF